MLKNKIRERILYIRITLLFIDKANCEDFVFGYVRFAGRKAVGTLCQGHTSCLKAYTQRDSNKFRPAL